MLLMVGWILDAKVVVLRRERKRLMLVLVDMIEAELMR
jgi:hypothetical protein